MYNNLIHEDKEKLYKNTLEELGNYDASRTSQVYFLLAQLESNKAWSYQPNGDTSKRMANVKALKIIDRALPKYKEENEGTSNLRTLRYQILP